MSKRCVVHVALVLACASPLHAQGDLLAAAARLQAGLRAYAKGDLAAYHSEMTAAARLVPAHPVLYYHLARAAALNGQPDSALNVLGRLAAFGLPRDPSTDSGFVSLWSLPTFRERVAALTAATEPRVASDTAFVVSEPNLVVENVAFDPVARVFYVGSMARRAILRSDSLGRATTLVPSAADIGQPLGMRVDRTGRTLWVAAIWPPDSAKGQPLQRSALLQIELPSGRVRRRYHPADTTRAHLLNDIALSPEGDLYVTDSDARAVWRLPRGGRALELWQQFDSTIVYPNGIALSPDGRTLFVAHQTGILAITRATREAKALVPPDNTTLMGIDGLYATEQGLFGIQNTIPAHQVVGIGLDYRAAAAPRVTCVTVLERRHPAYTMPTTGTVIGKELFYVANSELRRLDRTGALTNPQEERRTVILRLPLDVCPQAR